MATRSTRHKAKRVVILADMHCGHRVGLTPPAWQLRPVEDDPKRAKWLRIEQECWNWYAPTIARLRPIDLLVINGDAIDGPGARTGGTEQITTDRNVQIDMADKCISIAKAKRHLFIAGTPYHTGEQEDWERLLASRYGEDLHSHEQVDVNGRIFDFRHYVGSSSIPHGRATALLVEDVWNVFWADALYRDRADVIVRSHVHYAVNIDRPGGHRSRHAAITPALQAMGTAFGARRCRGLVNYGILYFDVGPEGDYRWERFDVHLASQVVRAWKL